MLINKTKNAWSSAAQGAYENTAYLTVTAIFTNDHCKWFFNGTKVNLTLKNLFTDPMLIYLKIAVTKPPNLGLL